MSFEDYILQLSCQALGCDIFKCKYSNVDECPKLEESKRLCELWCGEEDSE